MRIVVRAKIRSKINTFKIKRKNNNRKRDKTNSYK